jgi:hypothetical protein
MRGLAYLKYGRFDRWQAPGLRPVAVDLQCMSNGFTDRLGKPYVDWRLGISEEH